MRKLIYYVACTVDRFIAKEDGSFDCFPMNDEFFADLIALYPETRPGHLRDALDVSAGNRLFDAVVMGRRTYDVGHSVGITSPYPQLKQYVVSRSLAAAPDAGIKLINDDPAAAVARLKEKEGQAIWLCGGGRLAACLFPLIDELILKVNPIIIGAGIPLFEGSVPTTGVQLASAKVYDSGFLLAHYRIQH
jgi:dihydrofolate reductase